MNVEAAAILINLAIGLLTALIAGYAAVRTTKLAAAKQQTDTTVNRVDQSFQQSQAIMDDLVASVQRATLQNVAIQDRLTTTRTELFELQTLKRRENIEEEEKAHAQRRKITDLEDQVANQDKVIAALRQDLIDQGKVMLARIANLEGELAVLRKEKADLADENAGLKAIPVAPA